MQDDVVLGLLLASLMIFMMFAPTFMFKTSEKRQNEVVEAFIENEINKIDKLD